MDMDELIFKEKVLRECFKEQLQRLNVEGENDLCTVKKIKTYGALWHYVNQLIMAEEKELAVRTGAAKAQPVTTAEQMNIQATGLKMTGGK